jgi:hypothetical protein
LRRLELARFGTLPPARRASERPIAMACLRLVTFLPERPERKVPRFLSCIAFSTFCEALRVLTRHDAGLLLDIPLCQRACRTAPRGDVAGVRGHARVQCTIGASSWERGTAIAPASDEKEEDDHARK